jgi:hypothetical protein
VCDSFYSFIIPPKKVTIKRVFRIWGGFSGIFAGRKENPAVEGFKFRFVGRFVDRNKDKTAMHAYSFTRLRAGAPSRREP